MGDYIMRREQNNLHLICTEKERKNELIMQKLTRMRQDMNTNENKAKKGRQNKQNITLVGTAGFHSTV